MLRFTIATLALTLLPFGPGQAHSPAETEGRATAEPGRPAPSLPLALPVRRKPLGYGRLTSNDLIGDGRDRWRTGSVTMSRVWGYEWNGEAPARLGELLELRTQGQIIAPVDLRNVNPADRPYAGALSLGLHSYSTVRGVEYALGADLVVIGPQTGLANLQKSLHKVFGAPAPSDSMLALQIANSFRPTLVGEVGRTFRLGAASSLRPFAEARAGDETLIRIGADFTLGHVGRIVLAICKARRSALASSEPMKLCSSL